MPEIEIYTKDWCGYCRAAKALLERLGYEYRDVDVTHDMETYRAMVARADGRTTVPQIFVGKVHVGGSDDLHALERAGKLDALLAGEGQPA